MLLFSVLIQIIFSFLAEKLFPTNASVNHLYHLIDNFSDFKFINLLLDFLTQSIKITKLYTDKNLTQET